MARTAILHQYSPGSISSFTQRRPLTKLLDPRNGYRTAIIDRFSIQSNAKSVSDSASFSALSVVNGNPIGSFNEVRRKLLDFFFFCGVLRNTIKYSFFSPNLFFFFGLS